MIAQQKACDEADYKGFSKEASAVPPKSLNYKFKDALKAALVDAEKLLVASNKAPSWEMSMWVVECS